MLINEQLLKDYAFITGLSTDDKFELINYIEGMPSTLEIFVKLHINDDYMNPSIYKKPELRLSEWSTLKNYIAVPKITVTSASASDYQKQYCTVMEKLLKEKDSSGVLVKQLETILNQDCFNTDTLIETELAIVELLNTCSRKAINSFYINTLVLPYKFRTYDFYSYLLLGPQLGLQKDSFNHMSMLNTLITRLMKLEPTLSNQNDLATMIYMYLHELGVQSLMEKYGLFSRFGYGLSFYDKSNEYIEGVREKIEELADAKCNVGESLESLMNSHKMSKYFTGNDSGSPEPSIHDDENATEVNGYLFLFKNPANFDSHLDEISQSLRKMNIDEILRYMPEKKITRDTISFVLSDNDYGQVADIFGAESIGTLYDKFSHRIKFIFTDNTGKYFLLFKSRISFYTLYGLSLNTYFIKEFGGCRDNARQLMTIQESNKYYYKFIPTL